ncbi:hypothetical protein J6590_010321 [Homalodisca vitripennis]|nr:hypothetical protein J6590_010321 [Homalodisca vitripennis]
MFSEKLKSAEVKSFKKRNVNNPFCYSPILLLSRSYKIYEKAVEIQLNKYLEYNCLLNPSQCSFHKIVSIGKAISYLIDCVSGALDGSQSGVDVLNHEILQRISGIRLKIQYLVGFYL